jgi:hypothetical protein
MKLTKYLPVLLALLILTGFGYGLYLLTRPEPTPQELLTQNPRYTFMVQGTVRNLTPMIATWQLAKDQNGELTGGPKPDKDPRKYSVVLNIASSADIVPLNEKIVNAIPVPKPGDHTFTILEDGSLTMINMGAAELRIKYPVDSKGLLIYPVPTWDWVDDNPITLYCWEDIGSSGNPEHVCKLF